MPPTNAPRWTATAADRGVRLDKYLAAETRLGSRGRVADALQRGRIFLNEVEATPADASTRLTSGDVIAAWLDRPGSASKKLGARTAGDVGIVHEDADFIVLNKPVGLLAVPLDERHAAPSALDHVEDHLRSHGKRKPLVVHRIDRDTSGLVIFAKSARAQSALKHQFLRREPERVYWAVVYGHPSPPEGTWEDRLVWDQRALIQKQTHPTDPRGTDARCHYKVLERFDGVSLIEVRLDTGRRNQIRLQARLHGHTLVGERRYTFGPDTLRPIEFGRQALHAHRLTVRHPTTDEPMTFTAPVPHDMRKLLDRLRRAASAADLAPAAPEASPSAPAPRGREGAGRTTRLPRRRPSRA